MMGIHDLIVMHGIKEALAELAANPDRIGFMLSGFGDCKIIEIVGADYIDQVIDLVAKNKVRVVCGHEADQTYFPSVFVNFAGGGESELFIGDEGFTAQSSVSYAQRSLLEFIPTGIDGPFLKISPGHNQKKKIWRGVSITNGIDLYTVKSIMDDQIELDRDISNKTFDAWNAFIPKKYEVYDINSSMDSVKIECDLQTSGDYAAHRVFVILIRYCLKRARGLFDALGLQTATYNCSAPIPVSGESSGDIGWMTTFSISAKYTDGWIVNARRPIDKIDVCFFGTSVNKENEDVEL